MEKRGIGPGQQTTRRVLFVLALIAALAAALLIVWFAISRRPIEVVAPALSAEQIQLLSEHLTVSPPDARYSLGERAPTSVAPQVVIDLLGSGTVGISSSNDQIVAPPTAPIPQSILRTVTVESGAFAYPVALDHVELAYRRDLFGAELLTTDGRIRDLPALRRGLEALVGEVTRYPLVAAGGDDRTLLDVVSVFALSIGGSERYARLLELDYSDPTAVVEHDLGGGWSLLSVLNLLRDWRERGLVHPNWYDLSDVAVMQLAQRQVVGAAIMRLSTHRTWPVQTLHRIRTTPFPFAEAGGAGSAIVVPIVAAAYRGPANRLDEAQRIMKALVDQSFQNEVVRAWRLAPVHGTAEPLDRESRDLRFWAAASRMVQPSLYDVMESEQRDAIASYIRSRL